MVDIDREKIAADAKRTADRSTREYQTRVRNIKYLRENLPKVLLIDQEPPPIDLDCDNETWIRFFIPYYFKSAWRGKARLPALLVFGFIVYKILDLITTLVPLLLWPTLVVFAIFAISLYVLVLRNAFNGSYKWLGYLIWIFFFIMPIFGVIILGVQNGQMRIECAKDQQAYENALATNAPSKITSQRKAVLDACNVRLQACIKNFDKCAN